MSYAVTDAGEQDMRAELAVVESLNDEIDQLASQARDCDTLAPEVKTLLDVAWYFTEKAMRETNGCCSAACKTGTYCGCCSHFAKLRNKAESIRRLL